MISIGIDSVEIDRFHHWPSYHRRSLRRVFSEEEINYSLSCNKLAAEKLAARFAVKEALFKALSHADHHMPLFTLFSHCSITSQSGKPVLSVDHKKLGIPRYTIHCSWTHTAKTATAIVLLEKP